MPNCQVLFSDHSGQTHYKQKSDFLVPSHGCVIQFGSFPKYLLFTIIGITMATQHKQIDEQTLENLLYLSRLSPESTDMETLKKQVDEIVGYFDILSKYDDSENPYDAYPTTTADQLRDDTVVDGLEMTDVKKVSENFMDGYFQVPKVLGAGA